ncbi:hypothetical protein MJM28_28085, partial [Salmonella enterica subsp. enterica serovar Montevideo]|nr:hypothetical protein [Salmonella enterica subsp. enterica serovar Montevideo]
GWHLYSQRNPDGSIVFTVNGDITANTLRAGGAIYQNNGDIFGKARIIEPSVNPALIGAVKVPDGTVDPFRLTAANMLDAREHGA